jgi:hypothetical protein
MISYVVVSIISGIVFGVLDGLINANPLGRKLMEVYNPIARKSINVAAGVVIDIAYGFILAGIFVVLYESLPGDTGLVKGISFGLLAWFLRVIMSVISSWMMYTIPVKTLLYSLLAGLIEMLILALIYGGFLKPWT